MKRDREQGTLPFIDRLPRRWTHHICSQSSGQNVARWPHITAREPREFKLCPQWPHAQKILGGIVSVHKVGMWIEGQLVALPQAIRKDSK